MALRAKHSRRSHAGKDDAMEQVARPETTRLNADIPKHLHRRVKMQAAEEGGKMNAIIVKALEEYLQKYSDV